MTSADATVEGTIRTAIEDRSPAAVSYETTGAARRTVHLHVLFRAAGGEIFVDGYQVAGPTSSGERVPAWRQLSLRRISAIELLGGTFEPAPGYNHAADKYAGAVIAQV